MVKIQTKEPQRLVDDGPALPTVPEYVDIENQVEVAGKMKPMDGGYGWIVVAASFLVNMAVDGVIYTSGKTLMPSWEGDFKTKSGSSLVHSLCTGFYYFSGPLAAALVNVFGPRPVAMSGSVIASLGFIASYFGSSLPMLYVSFGLVSGIGFGMMYLPSIVILSSYFAEKRSLATGIAVCGSGIGTMVFAFVNEPVFAYLGNDWHRMMIFFSFVAFTGFFTSWLFKQPKPTYEQVVKVASLLKDYEGSRNPNASETPADREKFLDACKDVVEEINTLDHNPEMFYVGSTPQMRSRSNTMDRKEREALENNQKEPIIHINREGEIQRVVKMTKTEKFKESFRSLADKELLSSLSFFVLSLSGALTVMAFLIPFLFLSEYVNKVPGLTQAEKDFPLSLIGILNIVFRIACGYISDHPKISALQVSNVAIMIGGFSMMVVPFLTEYWHFLAFCVPFSAGVACFAALRSVICVELVGVSKLNNAFGILMVYMGFGALLGSPAASFITELTGGDYKTAFIVMGIVMIVSGIIMIPLAMIKHWENGKKKPRRISAVEMNLIQE